MSAAILACEDIFTMLPTLFRSIMFLATTWDTFNIAFTFTSMIRSNCSGVASKNDDKTATPALLTRRSIGKTSCTAFLVASQLRRSTQIVRIFGSIAVKLSKFFCVFESANTCPLYFERRRARSLPIPSISSWIKYLCS